MMGWCYGLISRVLELFFVNMYHFYHDMLCRIWQFVCFPKTEQILARLTWRYGTEPLGPILSYPVLDSEISGHMKG